MSAASDPRRRRLAACLAAVAIGLVALVGCGDDDTAADAVPALADHLQSVDAAIEGGDLAAARTALEGLVAETSRAHAAGELTDGQHDAIIAAAGELIERLPAPATTAPSTTVAETVPPQDADKDEDNDGKGNKNGKGRGSDKDDDDDD